MGLYNNHVNLDSFILDDDRVMFSAVVIKYKFLRVKISSTVTLYQEGAVAFEVKDYLIEQERVDYVELDQDVYYGRFSTQKQEL